MISRRNGNVCRALKVDSDTERATWDSDVRWTSDVGRRNSDIIDLFLFDWAKKGR